jgi:glycerol-3-phosphate dehydrogenase
VSIEDVLARRIGIQLYSWRDAINAAPVVGALMAKELQWTTTTEYAAIVEYVDKINQLFESAGLSVKHSQLPINDSSGAD